MRWAQLPVPIRPLMLALALASTPLVAHAAIYKWVDEDGNVVYSQQKPPGYTKVEVLEEPSPPVSDEEAKEQLESLREKAEAAGEERDLKEKVAEEIAEREERIKKNCEIARQNLALLETPARVTLQDAEGNPYFLEEEERQAKIEEARDQVARYCE